MSDVLSRIEAAKKAVLPSRLLRGAAVLGKLWTSGRRCEGCWRRACPCVFKFEFCVAKARWIGLLGDLSGGPPYVLPWNAPYALSGGEEWFVIEAMTVRMFEATGLTVAVQLPDGTRIRVGSKGTVWQTIRDLGALDGTADYGSAIKAAIRVQKALS